MYINQLISLQISCQFTYHGKQGEKQIAVPSQDIEGLTTQVHKHLKLVAPLLTTFDHVRHVRRQHKSSAVPERHKENT